MEKIFELLTANYPDATMVRRSKSNFLAIPDGEGGFYSVKVGKLNMKGTDKIAPFDYEAAKEEYDAWEAERAAKAAAPKSGRKSGPDPVKQEEKARRQEALVAWMVLNPGEHTCTEIKESMPEVYGDMTVMTVGSDLKPIVEGGTVDKVSHEGKSYYIYKG